MKGAWRMRMLQALREHVVMLILPGRLTCYSTAYKDLGQCQRHLGCVSIDYILREKDSLHVGGSGELYLGGGPMEWRAGLDSCPSNKRY